MAYLTPFLRIPRGARPHGEHADGRDKERRTAAQQLRIIGARRRDQQRKADGRQRRADMLIS